MQIYHTLIINKCNPIELARKEFTWIKILAPKNIYELPSINIFLPARLYVETKSIIFLSEIILSSISIRPYIEIFNLVILLRQNKLQNYCKKILWKEVDCIYVTVLTIYFSDFMTILEKQIFF